MSIRFSAVAAALLCAGTAHAHINEQAKIVPGDLADGDEFGYAVTLHGRTTAVGAPYHDAASSDGGAVYVHVRALTVWSEEAKLMAADSEAGDAFGSAVFLHDETLVVGAPSDDDNGADSGSVYVFVRAGTVWSQEAKLLAPDGLAGDAFGTAVAMSEDSIMVGAPLDDTLLGADAGTVHVFTRAGTVWTHEAQIEPAENESLDAFGTAVAIVHDFALIGTPGDDDKDADAGAVYAYERDLGVWSKNIKLRPTPMAGGLYGTAVGLAEEAHHADNEALTVVVGAPGDDLQGAGSGAVYSYAFEDDVWAFRGKLAGSSTLAGDSFGGAVSTTGETVLVGSRLDDEGGLNAGIGFAYTPEEGGLDEEILEAEPGEAGDEVGNSVFADGCWGLLGAHLDDDGGADAGAAYVFVLSHPSERYCTAGTSASGCVGEMRTAGFPSASETQGFLLHASQIEGQKDGMFFFGLNGRAATPWGTGTSTFCVLGPRQRMGIQLGNGTAGQCDGLIIQDFSAYLTANPTQNPGPGAVVNAQFWYRDPQNPSGPPTSLTDAVEFELCE